MHPPRPLSRIFLAARSSRAVLVAATLMTLLPSFGCKRIAHAILGKAEEKAGIDTENGGFTYKDPRDPSQSFSLGTAKVPEGFPKTIPIYPGATISGGGALTDKNDTIYEVGLTTKDSPDQIADYYKKAMNLKKFESDSNDVPDNPAAVLGRILVFKDPASGYRVTLTLQNLGENNGTSIQLGAVKDRK